MDILVFAHTIYLNSFNNTVQFDEKKPLCINYLKEMEIPSSIDYVVS